MAAIRSNATMAAASKRLGLARNWRGMREPRAEVSARRFKTLSTTTFSGHGLATSIAATTRVSTVPMARSSRYGRSGSRNRQKTRSIVYRRSTLRFAQNPAPIRMLNAAARPPPRYVSHRTNSNEIAAPCWTEGDWRCPDSNGPAPLPSIPDLMPEDTAGTDAPERMRAEWSAGCCTPGLGAAVDAPLPETEEVSTTAEPPSSAGVWLSSAGCGSPPPPRSPSSGSPSRSAESLPLSSPSSAHATLRAVPCPRPGESPWTIGPAAQKPAVSMSTKTMRRMIVTSRQAIRGGRPGSFPYITPKFIPRSSPGWPMFTYPPNRRSVLPNEGPPPAPDPAVPGLAALAEGQLDPLLEAAGALPLLRVRVLKQHVGSRCTLVVNGRSSTVVLKLFERPPTELVALHVAFRRAGLATGTGPTVAPMLAESAAAAAIVTAFFSEPPCRDLIVNGAAERAALLAGTWLQDWARSGN